MMNSRFFEKHIMGYRRVSKQPRGSVCYIPLVVCAVIIFTFTIILRGES